MNRLRFWLGTALLLSLSPLEAADLTPAEPKVTHTTRGVVREIAADRRTAVIRHENIPGYMPAMTMELKVKDPAELAPVEVGDTVSFRLLANDETHWIDSIRLETKGTNRVATAAKPKRVSSELKPGDPFPDEALVGEDGRSFRFADLRGRAVALTFFFTRCPLPDYCPRMNRSFAQARALLLANPAGPTNWQFLSISFDAEFDQPSVLQRYAKAYRGESADRWTFAAASTTTLASLAPRLDLIVKPEGAGFSHNLRTVVLDATGKIYRQFDGNEWTPAALARAMEEAARPGERPKGDPSE